MTKLFPQFPKDPQSIGLLKGLEVLSHSIEQDSSNEDLNRCAGYLYILGTAPLLHPKFYFNLYQYLKDDISEMSEHYNKNIYRRGQDYMLKLINQEIGEFGNYFNQFQLLMYSINERSNWDERLEPFSSLLWGFYCCLYDTQARDAYLDKVYRFVQISHLEEKQSSYN
jgi:hypothetical protein